MENEKYKIACKQVSSILNCFNQELLNLVIPKDVIERINENSAKDYEYDVDIDAFDASTLTDEASALLLILFNEYLANETQKRKIDTALNPQNYTNYDYNDLFKSTAQNEINVENNNQLTVVQKQNIIDKIIQKLKQIFLK